jgi:hypothetical protein
MGKMVLTVLGMVAEMELGFIKARPWKSGLNRIELLFQNPINGGAANRL